MTVMWRVYRLKCWTRDTGVWGSIPQVSVMFKSVGQALNPHCSGHPTVMSTWCTNPWVDRHVLVTPLQQRRAGGGTESDEHVCMHGCETITQYFFTLKRFSEREGEGK